MRTEKIVEKIIAQLQGRKGFDFYDLDEDILDEIKQELKEIIEEPIEVKYQINKEFHDYIQNGIGGRTADQIKLLESYHIIITDVSPKNVIMVSDYFEFAYNDLKN